MEPAARQHAQDEPTLVIDDLHLLHPGSASARFIEALCRQAPMRLHLVALSRHELPQVAKLQFLQKILIG